MLHEVRFAEDVYDGGVYAVAMSTRPVNDVDRIPVRAAVARRSHKYDGGDDDDGNATFVFAFLGGVDDVCRALIGECDPRLAHEQTILHEYSSDIEYVTATSTWTRAEMAAGDFYVHNVRTTGNYVVVESRPPTLKAAVTSFRIVDLLVLRART